MERQKLKKRLPAALALAYAVGVLVLHPWYTNGYVQMAQDKLTSFLGLTLICGALLAVIGPEEGFPKDLRMLAFSLAGFAGTTLLSALLSGDAAASLWGTGGYLGGFFLAAAAALGCLGAAVFFPANARGVLGTLVLLSGAGVTLLGILNNFGLDPLGFRAQLDPAQEHLFFSTIGNADYLSAYLCLWLPLAAWLFLCERNFWRAAGFFACVGLGFCGMASFDSGLTALGLAGAFLLLLLLVPLHRGAAARLLLLAAAWLGAQWGMARLSAVWPLLRTEHPFAALAASGTALPCIAVLLAAAGAVHRFAPAEPRIAAQRGMAAVIVGAGAGLFFLVNASGVSLGALDNFFALGPDWATGRGAIYADVWYCFTHGNAKQLLLGWGPGMLHRAFAAAGEGLPYPLSDTYGAHNEYLEQLLSCGLVGLAAYLAFLVCVLRAVWRAAKRCPAVTGALLCAAAYLVQAFFNNRVSSVFPLFMVVLGVSASTARQETPTLNRRETCLSCLAALPLLALSAYLGRQLLWYLFT